jgi:hypothetical protein
MKDNKYYTPFIEEFRVGFRCEFNEYGEWIEEIQDWQTLNTVFDINEHGSSEWGNGIADLYRVKYLDTEDILSLGFEQISPFSFEKTFGNTNVIIHYTHYKEIPYVQIFAVFEGNQSVRFSGKVKNINELEVILKQVGV